ncbi:putative ADP-ribosyl glycohydrolase [Niemeyer virus]|uniref:ADP-ribosyl glycohydrolase n=1 Tax=Acanthamoeba polyphaga mimivirus Kroon TaxID=3069720 RepID=A0A0G2Y3B8_9VIRU|nr:putative ADP-ribosyl glycohydrolase [Acanthamoeba polyphaga mimivirus]AKI80275.1 putative ADP-ribosyl glycohydrolase [Acanthamoeba polyphaga mimivirus Kroon]ALR83985.1 putative ADP-ribosyl glycohydrolase [Niemeyer virus]
MNNMVELRARNAILGAMVGDSLGATFEFTKQKQATKKLAQYNYLSNGLIGKGPFGLKPGQFTDDTEIALAIMSVIHEYGYYDQSRVAEKYHEWYNSNPFDIGNTTKNSLSQNSCSDMIKASRKYNFGSMSNGSLMRLFGLVPMFYDRVPSNRTTKFIMKAIQQDIILTHSNPEMVPIAIIYGLMLWYAIQGQNASDVYKYGKILAEKYHSKLYLSIYLSVDSEYDFFDYNDTKYCLNQIDSTNFGFVGFSIWLMLRSLKKHSDYRNAIIEIVSHGGDTDTNACITGALFGALYHNTIPPIWIDSVLNCQAVERYQNYHIADPKIWSQWLP